MSEILAICTDIDGTLLNKERQLSVKTIEIIKKLGGDLPVILASSRMPSAMRHLQDELSISHYPIIAYNGGYILKDGKVPTSCLSSTLIPASIVRDILTLKEGQSIHFSLYKEDNWFAPAMDQWTEREEKITKVKAQIVAPQDVIHQWEKQGGGAHKVMCMGAESEIHQLESALRNKFQNDIHIYRSRPTYLELAPKSISKATALRVLLDALYDFSMENLLSFGDNFNDIDMISQSGVGIAVENAIADVKNIAFEITGRSIDDGVASAIEKYCFPREIRAL